MNKEQIGSFVWNQRKRLKLSQQQLADKAGFKRYQQILEIEKAQFDYGVDVLNKTLEGLGFEMSFVPIGTGPTILTEDDPSEMMFDFRKVEPAKEEEPPKKINGHKIKSKNKTFKKVKA